MERFNKTAIAALGAVVVFFYSGFAETNIQDIHYRAGIFISKDSARLNFRKWHREKADAVIIYLSGLQSHSQWFTGTGDRLFEKRCSVYALDRRGSGLSTGDRGDILSYETWIDDLDQFVAYVKQQNPGIPVHLMANCFGSRITLGYSLRHLVR